MDLCFKNAIDIIIKLVGLWMTDCSADIPKTFRLIELVDKIGLKHPQE